ncbi:MAG TPA: hypothetical protein ENJ27_01580 [Candidatus Moranbacteria bacterium]|nr:hypothetical protein [Candidatus Moranbacteria bacterium]
MTNWIGVSLVGYFLLAFSFIIDKALLKKRITRPAVYAFYVSILSLLSIFLIPFGVQWVGWKFFIIAMFSGILFIWGLLFYYYAVRRNEISRVAPLVGIVVQITTFTIAIIFFDKIFTTVNLIGLFFLISGGFLISFDLPFKYKKILDGIGFAVLGGILIGIAYLLFEYLYNDFRATFGNENVFVNGFMWTRIGLVIGGASLFLRKKYRNNIIDSIFKKDEENKKQRDLKTIFFFVLNKIFGGTSSILINYAILLGGATKVQAVSSVQFVFVLILASLMMRKYPKIFEEKLYFWDWAQKIGAIGLIAIGILLIN